MYKKIPAIAVRAFNRPGQASRNFGLAGLRDFVEQNKLVSLSMLARHFSSDTDLLRHKLRHWVRRGCMRCVKKKPNCGTKCGACPVGDVELYEWIVD